MFVGVVTRIWSVLGPVVQIGLLTYVFYRFYMAVAQTKAQQIFKIVFVLLAVYSIAYITRRSFCGCTSIGRPGGHFHLRGLPT